MFNIIDINNTINWYNYWYCIFYYTQYVSFLK